MRRSDAGHRLWPKGQPVAVPPGLDRGCRALRLSHARRCPYHRAAASSILFHLAGSLFWCVCCGTVGKMTMIDFTTSSLANQKPID